jgi:hypothetical protein
LNNNDFLVITEQWDLPQGTCSSNVAITELWNLHMALTAQRRIHSDAEGCSVLKHIKQRVLQVTWKVALKLSRNSIYALLQ